MAALHRAPDAQRRRQRADQAEKGRRAGHPEGRVRRARPRAHEGVPPTRNRPDRGLLPQGGRGAGRCRGRRCPTWISPTSTTSGGTSTTCGIAPTASPSAAAASCRSSQQEVAHQDDGRHILGDGRGLSGPPLVRRRLDRQGRRGRQGQRARARLRGHRGRARGQDHRARGCRQPDSRQEGGVACAGLTAF